MDYVRVIKFAKKQRNQIIFDNQPVLVAWRRIMQLRRGSIELGWIVDGLCLRLACMSALAVSHVGVQLDD